MVGAMRTAPRPDRSPAWRAPLASGAPFARRWPWRALSLALGLGACDPAPEPLPTAAEIAALDRGQEPPLYQLLYDAPLLPADDAAAGRLRALIFIRHLGLSADQLDRLEALRLLAADRVASIRAREAEVEAAYAAEQRAAHDALWGALSRGVAVDAPELGPHVDALRELRAGGKRERELIKLRLDGIRSLLDAEKDLLASLTPRQEQLMSDAVFVLRRRLDPIGAPGDFRELVGTTYEPGQYAVLTRGLSEGLSRPLDIGGLWADAPMLEGHALHEARREVLLLLLLLEPGLGEAIAAARAAPGAAPAALAAPPAPAEPGAAPAAPAAPPAPAAPAQPPAPPVPAGP
jgi:hypothetical protein